MIKLDDAYDENNIFAKILRGEIPKSRFLKTTKHWLYGYHAATGHCLVIPKEPAVTFLDLSEDSAAAVMATAKSGGGRSQSHGRAGFYDGATNSSAAGQSVRIIICIYCRAMTVWN